MNKRKVLRSIAMAAAITSLATSAYAGAQACFEFRKTTGRPTLTKLKDAEITSIINGGNCAPQSDLLQVAREYGTHDILDLNKTFNSDISKQKFDIIYIPTTNIPVNTEIRFTLDGGDWADGKVIYMLMEDPTTKALIPVATTDSATDCFRKAGGPVACWPHLPSPAVPYIRFVTKVGEIQAGTRLVFSTTSDSISSPIIVQRDPITCTPPDIRDQRIANANKQHISITATYAQNFSSPGIGYEGGVSKTTVMADIYQQFYHEYQASAIPGKVSFLNRNFFTENIVNGSVDVATKTQLIHKATFHNDYQVFDFPVVLNNTDQMLVTYTSTRDLSSGPTPAKMAVVAYDVWKDGGASADTFSAPLLRIPQILNEEGTISSAVPLFVNRFYGSQFYNAAGGAKDVYFALENRSTNNGSNVTKANDSAVPTQNPTEPSKPYNVVVSRDADGNLVQSIVYTGTPVVPVYTAKNTDGQVTSSANTPFNMYADYKITINSLLDFGYGTTMQGLTTIHTNPLGAWSNQEEQDLCATTYDLFSVGASGAVLKVPYLYHTATGGNSFVKITNEEELNTLPAHVYGRFFVEGTSAASNVNGIYCDSVNFGKDNFGDERFEVAARSSVVITSANMLDAIAKTQNGGPYCATFADAVAKNSGRFTGIFYVNAPAPSVQAVAVQKNVAGPSTERVIPVFKQTQEGSAFGNQATPYNN